MQKSITHFFQNNKDENTKTPPTVNHTLFFDGCSKSNPGPAGIGASLFMGDVEIEYLSAYIGIQSNNFAEYTALIRGLEMAVRRNVSCLHVKGDSMLVINQMKGTWKVKHPDMKTLHVQAKTLEKKLEHVTYEHVYRHLNTRADELANESCLSS